MLGLRGEPEQAGVLIARAEQVLLPIGSNPMLAMDVGAWNT